MKIAFLTSRFPYPMLKGDQVRSYYPIAILSRRHEVDLYSFNDEPVLDAHRAHMEQFCRRIETVELRRSVTTARMVAAVFTATPSQVAYYRSRRMRHCIRTRVIPGGYDLVHLVCGRLGEYASCLDDLPRTIDWIDALSLSTLRRASRQRNPLLKGLFHLEHLKMKRFETASPRAFDYSIITSEVDRAFLGDGINEVVANGVDAERFKPDGSARDQDLVFTGNFGYAPNIDAVEYFCRDVFPLIRQQRPGVRFYIVGTNPVLRVRRFHDGTSVIVTGFVEDMARALNRSRVFVAPLLSGAGIQNKVLEAMACGLPVVATPFANGGIQARSGRELIVADDPAAFASAAARLLEDEASASRLGAAARDFVRRDFSWEAKARRLEAIFEESRARPRSRLP